jgi:hypothetical protein
MKKAGKRLPANNISDMELSGKDIKK